MESLIQLCHTYNLPSSLAQYRSSKTDRFSLEEINHWSDCQSKDIDRLSKHLEYLNNALNKTKSDLELNENRSKKQEENNRRLQQLINDDKQAKKALQDVHEQKLSQMKIDAEQQEKQIQQLNQQKNLLEEQLKQVNQLCKTHEEQIERLGNAERDDVTNENERFLFIYLLTFRIVKRSIETSRRRTNQIRYDDQNTWTRSNSS